MNINHLNVKFGKFELLEKIGEGGFGEVHRGTYLGTEIAVKQMKVKRLKIVKQSLLKEVEIHSHIRHPNIVLLMGYSIEADHLFILTELIDGPNLGDVLFGEQGHTIKVEQKHNIAKQVSQAIAYLHNRNPAIIHRDIKPENVLLSHNFEIAKVCDLGLSRLKTMNTMHSTILKKNEIQPGTPAYQAPEVLVNFEHAKSPADIWSLCCLYVELYTEEQVWDTNVCDQVEELIDTITKKMVNKEPPQGLVRLDSSDSVPYVIKQFIRAGLHYDKASRPTALNICCVLQEITKKTRNELDV